MKFNRLIYRVFYKGKQFAMPLFISAEVQRRKKVYILRKLNPPEQLESFSRAGAKR